jgi:histidinol-phosphate phosphatase family protein
MLPVAILAGGMGTRLYPLTEHIPKALIEVNGEPFLAHQLRLLRAAGIARVVICIGRYGESIREFAGDGARFGMEIEYSADGPVLLGTAGAVRQALPLLGDAFFVLYGDSYLPCSYREVEQAFQAAGQPALMTLYRNEGRWDSSNVEFSEGRILAYDKKNRTARMQHIDYGLGIFSRTAFDGSPHADLADIYGDLLRRGQLAACEVRERFYEIGSTQGIRELSDYLSASKPGPVRIDPTNRAVFLDRDGVLTHALVRDGKPYAPVTLDEMEIDPTASAALATLKAAGFLLIVVTNQPDVARGTTRREAVEAMHAVLSAALPLDACFVCYHDNADACDCRKPLPGLLIQAAAQHSIDLDRSFLVGDRWRDIDAGAAAGCRTILIDRGYRERGPENPPSARVNTLTEAVEWITRSEEPRRLKLEN